MRIEELVIEGFKSYPVRTQITGWDPSFNAITGLNGSGKSNILDAICFVLGITNMSQACLYACSESTRSHLQAWSSRNTKASVTIVFDNSDRASSPAGYQDYKQITIALPNVSKYLLNGHKALQANVQTLFQSVQLNINNPNFVIMQGRITKVLNMRPQEILGMVEEAAGTRMFEDRKDKAKKTMGKKEKRVQEIRDILDQEITPKLEKLRTEKRSYMQYQKSASELERLLRTLHACQWTEYGERAAEKQDEIDAKEDEIKKPRDSDKAEKEVADVTKKRDAEMSKGGKLKKLQDEFGELGKVLAKHRAQAEIKVESIKDEEARVGTLEAQLKEADSTVAKKKKQVEKEATAFNKVKEKHTTLETKLASDEELLQTLLTGLSSTNAKNKGGGYMGQLAEARARIAQASAEEEQSKVKLGMSEKELVDLEGRMRAFAKEAGDNMKKLENLKAAVQALEGKVNNSGWSAEQDRDLDAQLRQARTRSRTSLTFRRERVKSGIGRLNFDYEDPTPNFDRRKVKGVAAQLITLPEEHYNKATALEIAGGAKLFNVVIEDEKVGKDLIKNGRMKKRVTFIPLAKISTWTLSDQKLNAATRLAPGKVRTALSLVGYENDVSKAIAYIFSDTLICDDAETAKKVTFSRDVNVRSVTLEGDVYDPSGTLSGGSAPNSQKTLIQVQELLEIESKLREAHNRLQSLTREDEKTRSTREKWRSLVRDLEIKQHELKLLQEQVGGSNASLNASAVEKVKSTIEELRLAVQAAKDKQKAAQEECKKLERDMDEFKNNKDGKIDELKGQSSLRRISTYYPGQYHSAKVALQKHAVIVKTQQKELQTATLELEQIEGDIDGEKKQLEDAKEGIADLRKELEKLQQKVVASEAEYSKAENKLQEEMATLSRFDTQLKNSIVSSKRRRPTSEKHDIQTLSKEKAAAVNAVSRHEQMYPWILEEKDQFGKPNTQFDFTEVNAVALDQKCAELAAAQDGLKKKINPKVMNMIDRSDRCVQCREEGNGPQENMATVEKDKEKIEETIEELDRYKRDALQKTWEKGLRGDICGTPTWELREAPPPDGQDLMDGLEVKVQLGTVWKQSLTELSGGQRSLIALSLIMALLQFKPAPMYILDEIDAALDLSHTQHIGQLFRTRFKGSQFIVVSLKEGLFTNANVLFRARFRDGTSIVERTAQGRHRHFMQTATRMETKLITGIQGGGEELLVADLEA
ncbi:condensin complex subunit SMC2 [Flammula alnicola]|nr:condensin complex subunit SMC2 [Flammula alnicola]